MIDWTKPLEIVYDDEREPEDAVFSGMSEDENVIMITLGDDCIFSCRQDGRLFGLGHHIRNRAEPEAVTSEIAYATEEQPTLRDQFAMAALTGLIGPCAGDTVAANGDPEGYFAQKAYLIADAMMETRNG